MTVECLFVTYFGVTEGSRQAEDNVYLVLLSDPVSASLRLQVVLWVPVAVKDDDGVGRRKIDAETAGTCRQQETEILK